MILLPKRWLERMKKKILWINSEEGLVQKEKWTLFLVVFGKCEMGILDPYSTNIWKRKLGADVSRPHASKAKCDIILR